MTTRSLFWSILVGLVFITQSVTGASITINRAEFEIAQDEIYMQTAGKIGSLTKIPKQRSIEELSKIAQLRSNAGAKAALVLYEADRPRNEYSRRILTKDIAIRLKSAADAQPLADSLGLRNLGAYSFSSQWFRFQVQHPHEILQAQEVLRSKPQVLEVRPQIGRLHSKYAVPQDPLYGEQWYFRKTANATWGIGVESVWDEYRGKDIRIGVIDDGLALNHPDLQNNLDATLHYDFRDNDSDPSPDLVTPGADDGTVFPSEDSHGTAVGGLIAARGFNDAGISGVAPEAKLVGMRLIGDYTDDSQEAAAFAHKFDDIHIKNISWGPADFGDVISGPGPLALEAIKTSIRDGRAGKGTLFVKSAGNGALEFDNANKDGYATLPYLISVSAVGEDGRQAHYSEEGANVLITAPSGSSGQRGLATTDLLGKDGYNAYGLPNDFADEAYTNHFSGTSGSAPIVSGVVALMLDANPDLGWRDVQEILIRTAQKNDSSDLDWQTNGSPEAFTFNHKYGAGVVDAEAAVNLAKTWNNLKTERTTARQIATGLPQSIPENSSGLMREFDFSDIAMRVEHVQATISIEHSFRGELEIELTSPSGTTSRLLEGSFDLEAGIFDWTFMSVHFWGESAVGNWKLTIRDVVEGDIGQLLQATLTLRGSESGTSSKIPEEPTGFVAQRKVWFETELAWEDNSASETGFVIERCTDFQTPWEVVATTGPNETSHVDDTSAGEFVHYFYRIKAIQGARPSGYSASVDSYFHPSNASLSYVTGFENAEGYATNQSVSSVEGWFTSDTGSNRIVNNEFAQLGRSNQGNQLRIGVNQSGSAASHFAAQATFFSRVSNAEIRFFMPISDTANGNPIDNFGFALYNVDGDFLFQLDFDAYFRTINYAYSNSNNWIETGRSFSLDRVYQLEIIFDLASNRWSARLDGDTFVTSARISNESSLPADLFFIEAYWNVYDTSNHGSNYMLIDDFKVEVIKPDAPTELYTFPLSTTSVLVGWDEAFYADLFDLEYRIVGEGGWDTLIGIPNVSDGFPFTVIKGLLPGMEYEFRVRSRNSNGASSYSIIERGTTYTGFEFWLVQHDLEADVDPMLDYDENGTTLLMEYALGLSPYSYIPSSPRELLLEYDANSKMAMATYYQARISDVNYTVKYSVDMVNWEEDGVIQNQIIDGRFITAAYPLGLGTVRFFRLFVDLK